jgi:hypothetical protein
MTVAASMRKLIENAANNKAKSKRQANGVSPISYKLIYDENEPNKKANAY